MGGFGPEPPLLQMWSSQVRASAAVVSPSPDTVTANSLGGHVTILVALLDDGNNHAGDVPLAGRPMVGVPVRNCNEMGQDPLVMPLLR
jgi:hypothetical protein